MSSQWTVPMNHLYKPYCCRYMHKSTDNTAHIHSFCHLQLTVFNTIQYHSISIHSIPFKEYNIDSQSSSILFSVVDDWYTHYELLHKFSSQIKAKKNIAHIGSKWMNLIFLKCNRHFSIQTVQRRKQNRTEINKYKSVCPIFPTKSKCNFFGSIFRLSATEPLQNP